MHRQQRAFTLVEVLVVVVIIGIVVTMVTLSIAALGGDPPAEKASREIADLATLASQEAVMRGQEYGLRVEPHSYAFYIYDGRRWTEIKDDPSFRRHDLGDDVTLSLELQGAPVTLAPAPSTATASATATTPALAATSDATAATDDVNQTLPQLLLLSSGELEPFTIRVMGVDKDKPWLVTGTLMDGIQAISPDDAAAKQ